MPKKRRFTKTPLTLTELVDKFIAKGLIIPDKDRAQEYLRTIGYYRLVGYGLAFEHYDQGQHTGRYQDNIHFDELLQAYITDRKLRVLLLSAIERIEVAIRTIINQTLSERYQSAHWYLDAALFNQNELFTHKSLLHEITRATGKKALINAESEPSELKREQFIHHYYSQYDDPDYPACWMLAEVMSLGSWSKIYSNLSKSKDKKSIARQLDLSPLTLASWLHGLVVIRNVCAHHGRLFNRKLPMPPKQDKNLPLHKDNYASNYLAICYWLLKQVSPNSSWLNEVETLFANSPTSSQYWGINSEFFAQLRLLKEKN